MQLGMVLEPGGLSNELVTGTSWGELKFIDFRMVDSTGQTGVWKTVEAHSKGAMSSMAAHPYSPLLATATATQVTHSCHHCTQCFSKLTWQKGCSDECCSNIQTLGSRYTGGGSMNL